MKRKNNKGITLIALIVTIILMLILAGVVLNLSIGEKGIFNLAKQAGEEAKIASYKEKIELIKTELRMQNENFEEITISQIKQELDKQENNTWVKNTSIIIDEGIEKLKLTTKEGYIFYITVDKTEYKGKELEVNIEHTAPKLEAKTTDTSNIKRKTEIAVEELFETIWGSEGTGTIEYTITGKLTFQNIPYQSSTVKNLSELELGSYEITCKITTPSGIEVTAKKDVDITILAQTTVEEEQTKEEKPANAIYSAYDLAHFRDLVNAGQSQINGKVMNDIDLQVVCSKDIGSWIPIGEVQGNENWESWKEYSGIFDGSNTTISNIYVNSSQTGLGLFGAVVDATIKNFTLTGNVNRFF